MKQIISIIAMFMAFTAYGQMGYQVSLLDTNTGEPRTNEKVNVSIKITDSKGAIICDEQTTATSDAFGVLSLTIGNETTFDNANWQNTPFRITASVDGINIGSSDILSVPIAEYAKRTGVLTLDILTNMTVSMYDNCRMTFSSNGIATYVDPDPYEPRTEKCPFEIDGNNVYVYRNANSGWAFHYSVKNGKLYMVDD